MHLIRHRVNSLAALRETPMEYGAEIDIRSRNGRLILNHEPHGDGDELAAFLETYAGVGRTGTLILNLKEDGHEEAILELVRKAGIKDFFFLDASLPAVVRLALREGVPEVAVRVSEYESRESAMRFAGKARWVWADCFTGEPPDAGLLKSLKERFQICLVSPELEGYSKEAIAAFKPLAGLADAVVTKHPELWLK